MCSYCGCRANTIIARFTAEHEVIVNALGMVRRAADSGDAAALSAAADRLAATLAPHTAAEELALFVELRRDPTLTEHIDLLCAEHIDLDRRLDGLRRGEPDGFGKFEFALRRHIDKEENGLFPASVIALDGPSWTRVEELLPT
jgi:hemerythrin-like domain-containing protein